MESFQQYVLEYKQECLEKKNKSKLPLKELFEKYLYYKFYEQDENNIMAFMHNEFHNQLSVIYEIVESNIINEQIFDYMDVMEQVFLKKTKNNPSFIEVFSLKGTLKFIISSKEERAIELTKQLRIIKRLLLNNNHLQLKEHLSYLLARDPQNMLYLKCYKFSCKK